MHLRRLPKSIRREQPRATCMLAHGVWQISMTTSTKELGRGSTTMGNSDSDRYGLVKAETRHALAATRALPPVLERMATVDPPHAARGCAENFSMSVPVPGDVAGMEAHDYAILATMFRRVPS